MLEKIVGKIHGADAFVLEKTQVFMDRQQPVTGLTKFMYEKWLLICSFFFATAVAFVDGSAVLLVITGACCVLLIPIVYGIERKEKKFLLSSRKCSCMERGYTRFERCVPVFFFGGIMSRLLVTGEVNPFVIAACLAIVAYGYFASCIPRKPGKDEHVSYSLGL